VLRSSDVVETHTTREKNSQKSRRENALDDSLTIRPLAFVSYYSALRVSRRYVRYLARARQREAHRGPIAAADQPSKPSTEGRNLYRPKTAPLQPSDLMSFVKPTVGLRLILFRPACFPPLCEVPGSGKTARSPQGVDCAASCQVLSSPVRS